MIECACMSPVVKTLLKNAINTEIKVIKQANDKQKMQRIPELNEIYKKINSIENCKMSEIQQIRELEKLGW